MLTIGNPGKGISVNIDEADILLGNKGLLIDNNIDFVKKNPLVQWYMLGR